jgi:hypothetical protein
MLKILGAWASLKKVVLDYHARWGISAEEEES